MTWSREWMQSLSEDDLRTRVLVPLYRAMGFRDVTSHHGGILEQGKDIVMWKSDDVRRINYAVVVKAGRISGAAAGSSGAGVVGTQIRQALHGEYDDPVDNTSQVVGQCWVVASGAIPKEAVRAIKNDLTPDQRRVVTFINGDTLWDQVTRHLLGPGILSRLREARQTLASLSEDYDLVTVTGPRGLHFTPVPKRPDVQPLEFGWNLKQLEDESDGVLDGLKEHFRSGAPVTVPGSLVSHLNAPEFLRPFLIDGAIGEGGEIRLSTASDQPPIQLRAVMRFVDGSEQPLFEFLQVRPIRAGRDEATFENFDDPSPWRIRFVLDRPAKRLDFNFEANYAGMPVVKALRGVRAQNALALGGKLRFEDAHSGMLFTEFPVPPGTTEGANKGWTEFLEAAALIQAETAVALSVPDEPTNEDYETVVEVASMIRTGGVVPLADREVGLTIPNSDAAAGLLGVLQDETNDFSYHAEARREILGTEVSLGEMALDCEGLSVAPDDLRTLKSATSTGEAEWPLVVRLRGREQDPPWQLVYRRWASSTDAAGLVEDEDGA